MSTAYQIRIPLFACVFLLLTACQSSTTYRPELNDDEIRAEEAIQQQMLDELQARGGTPKRWKDQPGMRKQFERVAERIEKAGADICREMGVPAIDNIKPFDEVP